MSEKLQNTSESDEANICCVCVQSHFSKQHKITENFIKLDAKYLPIRKILYELNLINYQVKSDQFLVAKQTLLNMIFRWAQNMK